LSTFGTTTIGGTTDTVVAQYKQVFGPFTCIGGDVTKLTVYLAGNSANNQTLKGVIYAKTGSVPGALMGITNASTFNGGTLVAGWYDLTFASPVALVNGDYFIGWIADATSAGIKFYYDTVTNKRFFSSDNYSDGPTDPFGSPTNDSESASFYATFAAARLPVDQSDNDVWGPILNNFLSIEHNAGGTHKAAIERTANKGSASGYASLDSGAKVPVAQLATGTPDGTKFLRDDRAWVVPSVGAGAPSLMFTLASGTSVGATSVTLDRVPTTGSLATPNSILVGAGTATAELRTVTSLAGAVVGVGAFTYAHSANDIVLVLNQPFVTAQMWGCKGVSTINDTVALQEAVIQATASGMWLDGQGYQYYITEPWMVPQSHRIRHGSCRAGTAGFPGAFSPAEASNAMVMVYNGARLLFTADSSTDFITTPSAHGVGNDIRVVVQGPALPGGLVSGRVYFAKAVTSNTMQLALTAGGAAVDITSAGSGGTVYCEVYSSNAKSDIQDWTIEGANVANLNGLLVSLQQQTDWYKFRVNNCPGYGVKVTGQQANWEDIEIINCGDSVIFDNMSFLYCRVLNCEQFSSSAVKGIGGGLVSSTISGFHFESRDTAGVFVDFSAVGPNNCLFECGSMSGFDSDFASWVGFEMAGGWYDIRDVFFPQGTPSAPSAIAVHDSVRGKTIHVWNDTSGTSCNRTLGRVYAPAIPSSFVYLDDERDVIWGQGGRYSKRGSQTNGLPWEIHGSGTTATADLEQWRDSADAVQFAVTKDAWAKFGGGTAIKALSAGATSVANGGTVTHGLGTTPTLVKATPTVSGEMVSVTALGATTFTVAIIKNDGTAGTTQTIYWETLKI
jgi:hypothetical protein